MNKHIFILIILVVFLSVLPYTVFANELGYNVQLHTTYNNGDVRIDEFHIYNQVTLPRVNHISKWRIKKVTRKQLILSRNVNEYSPLVSNTIFSILDNSEFSKIHNEMENEIKYIQGFLQIPVDKQKVNHQEYRYVNGVNKKIDKVKK